MIGVVMGSKSDWRTMKHACEILHEFGCKYETKIVSAHRTPDLLFEYAETAKSRGITCIIAGAGGSAHLPGMLAAKTRIPVLGVPVESLMLGLDSLLSIVNMPRGVPVATFAINGAANAALFALAMLAVSNPEIDAKLENYRKKQAENVLEINEEFDLGNNMQVCTVPPKGWACTRRSGHSGPCAALPV